MITISKIKNALESLVDFNLVRNIAIEEGKVSFDLIKTPAVAKNISNITQSINSLEGVESVTINEIEPELKTATSQTPQSIQGIKNIIAISSCKGGVGKSTLAAHIAQEFANKGYKTGLLDADIYGPSIPTLFGVHKPELKTNERNQITPLDHNKLKLMSFGFLLGDAPAVMRGPIVTRYIQQMLINTDWGELDYLFIDMPPGTGDVHLTITQIIRLNGTIIITTPHTLSLIDVARGILMFEKVNVPILGVIENMSYFVTDESSTKHYVFGETSANKLNQQFGVETLAEIPILKGLNTGLTSNAFVQNAVDMIHNKIEKVKMEDKNLPKVTFDQSQISLQWNNGETWSVNNRELRLNSQDALSVDEMSGKQLIKDEDIRADIAPKDVSFLGNYAIGITWNDGHAAGIYPYALIESLAKKEEAV